MAFPAQGIKTAVPVRIVRTSWVGWQRIARVADGKPTLRAARGGPFQATWDEVTEEARRRFSNLSRVE